MIPFKEGYADFVFNLDDGSGYENAYILVYDNGILEIKKEGMRLWGHMANYEVIWESPISRVPPDNLTVLKGGGDGEKPA